MSACTTVSKQDYTKAAASERTLISVLKITPKVKKLMLQNYEPNSSKPPATLLETIWSLPLTSLQLSKHSSDKDYKDIGDEEAKRIATELPNLQSLKLSNNRITNAGLSLIANGLPHLTVLHIGNDALRVRQPID